MIIKSSTMLRNKYKSISAIAHKNGEPICITLDGERDLVVMSIESFEKREALLKLREKVLFAEQSRVAGESVVSLKKAAAMLNKKYGKNA